MFWDEPTAHGLSYDAVQILGLGDVRSEPLPQPGPGEVVIRVGPWSLHDLKTCNVVVRHDLLWDQKWYEKLAFFHDKLSPGMYRLRVPLPCSEWETWDEQQCHLQETEMVVPTALVAAALLCHVLETGTSLLRGMLIRCAEALPPDLRVTLDVFEKRLSLEGQLDGSRKHNVSIVGCMKI